MAFDAGLQRRIMGRFATGVTIVTTNDGERFWGMTANSVTSLSLDPPLVLVAVDRRNTMHSCLIRGRCFAVNVLTDQQEALSGRFAARGPKDFSDLEYTVAVTGSPILVGSLAYLDCRLVNTFPGGDHEIFVGEILAGAVGRGEPLLYYNGQYVRLARSTPPTRPTGAIVAEESYALFGSF